MDQQEVASKLIASSVGKDEDGNPLNPIDAHFSSLRLSSMEPIGRKTKEFGTLETYVRETHGTTHHIKVDVLNAFRVERYACMLQTLENDVHLYIQDRTKRMHG